MPVQPSTTLAHHLCAVAVAAVPAACGGGAATSHGVGAHAGGGGAGGSTPAAAALSGTVAVGAPISGGRLRVLDARGAVVASDIEVAAHGSCAVPIRSGTVRIPLIADTHSKLIADSVPGDRGHPGWVPE